MTQPPDLRTLPRWDRAGGELSQMYGSTTTATRWEENREVRIEQFGRTKQWKTLSDREAFEQYLLRSRDLEGLPHVLKYDVYGTPRLTRFYVAFDVQDRALARWGSAAGLRAERGRRRAKRDRRVARIQPQHIKILRPVRNRNGVVVAGSRAVGAAILGNIGVVAAKLGGWAFTGSGAMLSEAFHSMADVGNQCLLMLGLQQSMRQPDASRPYGYGFEQYVWAMISGVSTFILGAGVCTYHGVSLLLHPEPLEHLPTCFAVLAATGALEAYTLSVAWREMVREANKLGMSPRQYLIDGPDPLNPAVLLEDSASVVGILVAGTAIGLTHVTGNPMYDAMGSIAVGGMLGSVALFIVERNRRFLTQVAPARTPQVVSMLLDDQMVLSVQDVKSVNVGPSAARFKAEIQFNAQLLSDKYLSAHDNLHHVYNSCRTVDSEAATKAIFERYGTFLLATLSIEIDRLEHQIKAAFPEFVHIDLEVL